MNKPTAIELFAGIGGFRLGLQKYWDVIWSNQWEPSTKIQHASNCYVQNFGTDGHFCEDINNILIKDIPSHDLLTAGFPCQDYSIGNKTAKGLVGKKGNLWWTIHEILKLKRPRFILLENVDRLLKSPVNQRGRDFAIILSSLMDLDYTVEWRVINAADYGFPQRRRRVFIVGEYKKRKQSLEDLVLKDGYLVKAFPIKEIEDTYNYFYLDYSLETLNNNFGIGAKKSIFQNAGVVQDFQGYTKHVHSLYKGHFTTLGDILQPLELIDKEFFIDDFNRWTYLKGSKKISRIHKKTNLPYVYTEGAIPYPDTLEGPSRTIITSEGGKGPSRTTHVVQTENILRRLTPVELERLNGFPDNWTQGLSNPKRAFLMGNALVIGIVERISEILYTEKKNNG